MCLAPTPSLAPSLAACGERRAVLRSRESAAAALALWEAADGCRPMPAVIVWGDGQEGAQLGASPALLLQGTACPCDGSFHGGQRSRCPLTYNACTVRVCRPGDELLAVAGSPYDTLEEVRTADSTVPGLLDLCVVCLWVPRHCWRSWGGCHHPPCCWVWEAAVPSSQTGSDDRHLTCLAALHNRTCSGAWQLQVTNVQTCPPFKPAPLVVAGHRAAGHAQHRQPGRLGGQVPEAGSGSQRQHRLGGAGQRCAAR